MGRYLVIYKEVGLRPDAGSKENQEGRPENGGKWKEIGLTCFMVK